MSLVDVEVQKHDRVVYEGESRDFHRVNTRNAFRIEHGEILEVTAVFTREVNVKTLDARRVRGTWETRSERIAFRLPRDLLSLEDPNRPVPRRLGEKPADTDHMTYVSIDDPGIQWLFEDMGTYATNKGYCSEYDALTARLGIPGRPRDFHVNKTVGGLQFSVTVKARSQKEANELVANALTNQSSE